MSESSDLCSGAGAEPLRRQDRIHVGGAVAVGEGTFGDCPACRQSVRLTADGTVADHKPV